MKRFVQLRGSREPGAGSRACTALHVGLAQAAAAHSCITARTSSRVLPGSGAAAPCWRSARCGRRAEELSLPDMRDVVGWRRYAGSPSRRSRSSRPRGDVLAVDEGTTGRRCSPCGDGRHSMLCATIPTPSAAAPPPVLLFSGHLIDAPDRPLPPFPAAKGRPPRVIAIELERLAASASRSRADAGRGRRRPTLAEACLARGDASAGCCCRCRSASSSTFHAAPPRRPALARATWR